HAAALLSPATRQRRGSGLPLSRRNVLNDVTRASGGAWGQRTDRSAGPPQARSAPSGAATRAAAERGGTDRPQRRAAPSKVSPLGGSDPRSGGAWGHGQTAAPGRPKQGQPPRGAATRAAAERGGTDRPQ